MPTPTLTPVVDLHVARGTSRLDSYFGLWAIEPATFRSLLGLTSRLDMARHIGHHTVEAGDALSSARVEVQAGKGAAVIQVVDLDGTLMKHASSIGRSTSTVLARQAIRNATNDDKVDAILLRIDSPGGTVAGTHDLADAVKQAAKVKPVYAHIEDMGASAAYWVGSQASKVFANQPDALVGSIGTLMGMYDVSGMAEKEGIKALVFSTGKLKGAGFAGAPVTDQQQAYFQGIVDQTQVQFDAAVKTARGINSKQLEAIRTGEVFMATRAKDLKLIDGIQTVDQTLAQLAEVATHSPDRPRTASVNTPASAPHVVNQSPTPTPTPAPQAKPKPAPRDAVADWDSAIAELQTQGATRADAIRQMQREDPELHAAYLAQYNRSHAVRR